MRKITGVIGQTNSLFVCLNQIRTKIGVMYGDPDTTPGGKAIPFHSSIRIKLGAGQQIKDGDDVIGIQVWAKTVKNKVAPPFRKVNFQIHFGKGIVEHEEMFDLLRKHGIVYDDDGEVKRSYLVSGTGGWKSIEMFDENGTIIDSKKFRKIEFNEIIEDDFWGPIVEIILKNAMVKKMGTSDGVDIDTESYEEMKALADELDM